MDAGVTDYCRPIGVRNEQQGVVEVVAKGDKSSRREAMVEQGLKRNCRRLRNRSRTGEPSQQQLGFLGSRPRG
jgi:hypothetical protein